jgi:hypothetical protein
MGALNREGGRREVPDMIEPGYDLDEPVFTLGISNLRELQFNAAAFAGNGWYERTNWSGEIMPGRWMHVAATNDPVTKESTLYVDGAPVLRNSIDALGLNSAGKPWRIGSSMSAGRTANGWFGCVGETRIVDHVLSPDQWLTARRYVPASAESAVGGEVPATLALTLGAPASFGAFAPGVAKTYTATTTATVTSSAGDASLTVTDPSTTAPGHLVNGSFSLPAPLGGLGAVKTYDAPVAGDVVPVTFTQAIGAADALRTGSYAKTVTFALATANP